MQHLCARLLADKDPNMSNDRVRPSRFISAITQCSATNLMFVSAFSRFISKRH